MNNQDVQQTIAVVQQANAILNMQLMELQSKLDKAEFSKMSESFGRVMGELFVEILAPLYKQYPEFSPEQFGGSAPKIPDDHFINVFALITSQMIQVS